MEPKRGRGRPPKDGAVIVFKITATVAMDETTLDVLTEFGMVANLAQSIRALAHAYRALPATPAPAPRPSGSKKASAVGVRDRVDT